MPTGSGPPGGATVAWITGLVVTAIGLLGIRRAAGRRFVDPDHLPGQLGRD
jgi:hypothetical protein